VGEVFAMGGYGAYVWSAFGVAALVLLALFAQSWHAARRREDELRRLRDVVRAARPLRPASEQAGGAAGVVARPAEVGK
jgi:heme exporter protein D